MIKEKHGSRKKFEWVNYRFLYLFMIFVNLFLLIDFVYIQYNVNILYLSWFTSTIYILNINYIELIEQQKLML